MNVGNVGLLLVQQLRKFLAAYRTPNRSFCQADPFYADEIIYVSVTATERNNLMPVPLQHLAFLFKDDVLAPTMLVRVVN
jgi:hypothetical protein